MTDKETIHSLITDGLDTQETHTLLKEKMLLLSDKLNQWLKSEEGKAKLEEFTAKTKSTVMAKLSEQIRDMLPVLTQKAMESKLLWGWVENTGIPGLKNKLIGYITDNKQEIINNLQLDKRVEKAINNQDIRQFHEMVNKVAAQHLGAIQVIGYILGAIIGALQLLM